MPFPLSISGRLVLPADGTPGPKRIVDTLEDILTEEGVACVQTREDGVSFFVGDMKMNAHIFGAIDSGSVDIETGEAGTTLLRYRMSMRNLAVMSALAAFAFGALIALMLDAGAPLEIRLAWGGGLALAAWLFLTGANYVGVAARLGGWLDKAVKTRLGIASGDTPLPAAG